MNLKDQDNRSVFDTIPVVRNAQKKNPCESAHPKGKYLEFIGLGEFKKRVLITLGIESKPIVEISELEKLSNHFNAKRTR